MSKIKGYRNLSAIEIEKINELKDLYAKLLFQIIAITEDERIKPDMRSHALAKTKIEESAMWAVKSIARPDSIV